jgi:anti-sigma B factor antagonist
VNFSATVRDSGQISIVDVKGRLTSFETGALRDTIARLLKQGKKQIVLNLSGLVYLDSSGIGELVQNYLSVIKRGGEMKVVGLTAKVEEILKITQLHQVLQEFQDEQSALRSFPESTRKNRGIHIVEQSKN